MNRRAIALSGCTLLCCGLTGFFASAQQPSPTPPAQPPAGQSPSGKSPAPKTPGNTQAGNWQAELDPQMKAVLDAHASLNPKPITTLSPEEARQQPSAADAVKALMKSKGMDTKPEDVGDTDDRMISGPAGEIPIRIYTPKGEGPFPVVVYYHGGGWVLADLDTYDASCRALCNAAKSVIVSSDYRHAPEHPFPAAAEDAFAAYEWARENADSIKGDPNKIAVAGESAGGNLAIVTCLKAREKQIPLPVHQVLVYPVVQHDFNTPSYQQYADAKPLNRDMMKWFSSQYLKSEADGQNPHASPMLADLKGMPPATIITAQIDPLRSEGEAFAQKLKQAGVDCEHRNFDGVTHEFFGMGAVISKAKQAQQFAAQRLMTAFGGGKSSAPAPAQPSSR